MSAFDASEKEVFSGLRDGIADLADAMQGIRQAVDTTLEREAEERRTVTDKEYDEAWSELIEVVAQRGVISRILLTELRKELEDRNPDKVTVYPYHLQVIAKKLYQDW